MRNLISFLLLSVLAFSTLAADNVDSDEKTTLVNLTTDFGVVTIALDRVNAPITCSNFLKLIADKKYSAAHFYRVVRTDNDDPNPEKIHVVQGGIGCDRAKTLETIAHESTDKTRLRHLDGTISMARREPGTATSEFFICIGNNPSLDFGGKRKADGQGFAAFGTVVSGMEIIRAIAKEETTALHLVDTVDMDISVAQK